MKYTHLKTAALMLSASALLVLSGCDGTAGTASNSGIGEVPAVVSPVTPPVVPPVTPPVVPPEPASCLPDFSSMTVLGYPYQPEGAIVDGLNGAGLSSLAFSLDGSVAYTITTDSYEPNQLVVINPIDGSGTIIGEAGNDDHINDLATQPNTGRIFGSYWGTLVEINITDGNVTDIGGVSDDSTQGLAFASNGTLYYVDGSNGNENLNLYTLDPTDASTLTTVPIVDSNGSGNGRYMGLGFNTHDGKLYAASRANPGEIYTIDPTDGNATLIGSVDCPNGTCYLHDIDFHPITGEMYGVIGGASGSTNPDDLVGAFVKWGCQQ